MLLLDSYQADVVVIYELRLGLIRKSPSTRSASIHFVLKYIILIYTLREAQVWDMVLDFCARKIKLCRTSKRTRKRCGQMMGETWRKRKESSFSITSSTCSNFFTPVPTHMTHSDLMSCSSHLLLLGWNLQWHHWQSHQLLPLAMRTWWCNPGIKGLTDRRWWYNHSAGEGQDAFMVIWMCRQSGMWKTQILIKC